MESTFKYTYLNFLHIGVMQVDVHHDRYILSTQLEFVLHIQRILFTCIAMQNPFACN